MTDIAIRVESLSKHYKITALRCRHDTLSDQLMDSLKGLFRLNGRPPFLPGRRMTRVHK